MRPLEQLAEFADGAEQMHPHGGFTQAKRLTDFTRRVLGDVAQREDEPLAIRELLDRRRDLSRPLARHQTIFGAGLLCDGLRRSQRIGLRRHWQRPPQAAGARLAKIETAVHEDAREPDLEGVFLAIAGDVYKHFEKGVLNRLVGVVSIAQVVVRNAHCATLLSGDQVGETVARRVTIAREDEGLDGGGQFRIPGRRRRLDSCWRFRCGCRHRSSLEPWLGDASRRRSHWNTAAADGCLPSQGLTFSLTTLYLGTARNGSPNASLHGLS